MLLRRRREREREKDSEKSILQFFLEVKLEGEKSFLVKTSKLKQDTVP